MPKKLSGIYIKAIIGFFIFGITVGLILSISAQRTVGDFDVYYAASQNYLARAPIYVPGTGIEEFKYSPLFALVFSVLTLIGKIPALYLWSILNILLLYAVFYLFYRLGLISFKSAKDFLLVFCLLALTGRFIFAHIKLGQANILICFLLTLAMYCEVKKKEIPVAIALALSVMIKFFPLLFLAYYILRRRFKLVGLTVLFIALFLLLPALYSGLSQNFKYLGEWFSLLRSTPANLFYSTKNSSLLSFFSWIFIVRNSGYSVLDVTNIPQALSREVYFFWALACFVPFCLFFFDVILRKARSLNLIYLDYSGLFICGLLFNPLSSLNALVLLFVPYFFILRQLFYFELSKKRSLAVASLTLLCFIFTMAYNKVFFKDMYQFYQFLQYKLLMWLIILVYGILLLLKFSQKTAKAV